MRGFEHFILKHIVLDKSFNIISEKIFDPSKDRAYSKHDISGYSDSLFVLSICNLHDTWLEPVQNIIIKCFIKIKSYLYHFYFFCPVLC